MKNRYELRQYLRFQLEQMSAKNQQHLFEEMAFELALQTVSRRLIPATGPVQAGGDQGRDFESFHSYLARSALASSVAIGVEGDDVLVFGCTLNKELPQKIKGDIATMSGAEPKPNRIYYYAAPDLPVAKRHELQAWSRRQYGAELEVFDGQAIASLLAEPAHFWIAEQFLGIPADMFPAVESDAEYGRLKERWLGGDRTISNYSDFVEVKRGLRQATFNADLNPHLGSWLSLMEEVAKSQEDQIQRRALYEIAVAQLRGRGSLDPVEWAVEQYFISFAKVSDPLPSEVEDATLLASYSTSAITRGEYVGANGKATAWADLARTAIDRLLEGDISNGSKFRLLLVRGHLDFDAAARAEDEDARAYALLKYWEQATSIAETSPFADIEAVASLLEMVIPAIGDHPRFRALADRVDAVVAANGGKAAGADQGRKRALQYLKSDQLLLAIDQLQRVKEGWFSGETMRGSVLAMLQLSKAYLALHLPLAARYYAAAALYSVANSTGDELRSITASAAFAMADTYLHNGEGLSYMSAAGRASEIHLNNTADPEELEEQPEFAAAIVQSTQMLALIASTAPNLAPYAEAILDAWDIDEAYVRSMRQMAGEKPWHAMPVHDVEAMLAEQSGQGLFGDVGGALRFQWHALGINWAIDADTELRTEAEALGSVLQICLVDLADVDLLIVPGEVNVTIERGVGAHASLTQQPDNGVLRFSISIPVSNTDPDEAVRTMAMVSTMILQASAMPFSDFEKVFEAKMKRGLAGRAFWVQPVGRLVRDVRRIMLDGFPDLSGETRPPIAIPLPLVHPELSWRDGDAPGYSSDRARVALSNRYSKTAPMARVVVPKLLADPAAGMALAEQHERGLPDWQLLNAVYNFVLNAAIEEEIGGPLLGGTSDAQGVFQRAIQRLNSGDIPPIDVAKFTPEFLTFQMNMNVLATLRGWGLELHRQTPDVEGVRKLLNVRYRSSIDDIPHEDFFDWTSGEGGSDLGGRETTDAGE